MGEACLYNGEKIILEAQGTMQSQLTWKPGHLFLTNRRLVFINTAKPILDSSLDKIIEICIIQRKWLMGIKVKQLCIEFSCGSERGHVYIALAKPNEWVHMIKESMTLMLAERWGCNGTKPESPGNT